MDESVYEQASRVTQQTVDDAVDEIRRRNNPELPWVDERGVRICLDCEWPIEVDRVARVPDAVRCVECQRDQEHRDHQLGRMRL